jgi:lipopolysaccharide export LptBFGC system permease protein LptF
MISTVLTSIFIIATVISVLLFAVFLWSEPLTHARGFRIQKVTLANGEVGYYIQQQMPIFYIWINCSRMVGIDTYEHISFKTEQEARDYIDGVYKWIEEIKGTRIKQRENINP